MPIRNLPDHIDFSELVVLCGAGTSYSKPTDLPTVKVFYREVMEYCGSSKEPFLTESSSQGQVPRFESIMNDVQKYADRRLQSLSVFESENYNSNHAFLAQVLKNKGTVITTNFDLCIEHALNCSVNKMIFSGQDQSFELPANIGTLIKAHGCLSTMSNNTLVSTIKLLAETKDGFANFPLWKNFLLSLLKGKIVTVLGYSGSDDFDIMPLLRESKHKNCIWIDFNPFINLPLRNNKRSDTIHKKTRGIRSIELYAGTYSNYMERLCGKKLRGKKMIPPARITDTLAHVFPSLRKKIILSNVILFHHQQYQDVLNNSARYKRSCRTIELQKIQAEYKLGRYDDIIAKSVLIDKTDLSDINLEIIHHISSSYYYAGKVAASKRLSRLLISLSRKSRNTRFLLEGLFLYGSILSNENKIDQAAKIFNKVFPLLEEFRDLEMEGKAHWACGEIAQKNEQFDEANKHFKIARQIYGDLNFNSVIPILDSNISGTLADAGKLQEALKAIYIINDSEVAVLHYRVYVRFLKVQLLLALGFSKKAWFIYSQLMSDLASCSGHPFRDDIKRFESCLIDYKSGKKFIPKRFLY